MKAWHWIPVLLLTATVSFGADVYEYRVLATNRTSTMEKELNETARAGFRLQEAMGGQRYFSGNEVAVVMSRPSGQTNERYQYRVLATNKTSTMEKELQSAAADGFEYRAQTVFETSFGGKEVVVILEKDLEGAPASSQYRVLATSRTSTMDKELAEVGAQGFEVLGLSVAETAFGGNELVAIVRRSPQ